jgi:hypothetical protein
MAKTPGKNRLICNPERSIFINLLLFLILIQPAERPAEAEWAVA